MKRVKKLLCLLLTLVIMLEMLPVQAAAQSEVGLSEVDEALERLEELERQLTELLGEEEDAEEETEDEPAEEHEAGTEELVNESKAAQEPLVQEPEAQTVAEQANGTQLRGDGETGALAVSAVLWLRSEDGGDRPLKSGEEVCVEYNAKSSGVYAMPQLCWSDDSEEALPEEGKDGCFEYLWLYAYQEAESVDVWHFCPLNEEPEVWQGTMKKLGVQSFADLLEFLTDNKGWTTDPALPVLGADAVASPQPDSAAQCFACAVRWVSYADKGPIACGASDNFVRLAVSAEPEEPLVLIEPAPLEDCEVSGDCVDNRVTLAAEARYGDAEIQYQWYRATERDYAAAEPIDGATGWDLSVSPHVVGESLYYYCEYRFVNAEGETEIHKTNICRVFTTPVSLFTVEIEPGRLYGGSLAGYSSAHVENYRKYMDYETPDCDFLDESLGYYYQSTEQTSLLSVKLSVPQYNYSVARKLAYSDYMTVQWFGSATPDYTQGGVPLSGEYRVEGLSEKENLALALIDCTLACPNDSLEPYYVTLVAVNHYTMDGVDYTLTATDVGKVFTVATNAELYRVNEQGELIGYIGHEDVMTLPETVGGVQVTGMEDYTWGYNNGDTVVGPKKLVVPGAVRHVSARAFANTVTLEELELAEGVESIGERAFYRTPLQSLTLPATLQSIGDKAFRGVPLSGTLTLPASLASIGEEAFYGTQLTRVEFADETFPVIGTYAFCDLPELRSIHFPADAQGELSGNYTFTSCPRLAEADNFESILNVDWEDDFKYSILYSIMVNGVLTDGQFTYEWLTYQHQDTEGNVVESFTGYFARYTGDPVEELVFPETFRGEAVIGTLDKAVPNATKAVLKRVTLPSGYVFLKGFGGCEQLESVNFSELTELRSIADSAFADCCRLASPVVLQEFSIVGFQAFVNCFSLPSLTANGAVLFEESFNYCYSLSQFDENFRGQIRGNSGYQNFNYTALYTEKQMYYRLAGSTPVPDQNAETLYVTGKWAYTGTPENATLALCMDPWSERVEIPGELENANGEIFQIKTVGRNALYNLRPTRLDVVLDEGIEDFDLITGNRGYASDLSNASHRLRSVSFPNTLTTLHDNQFYGCFALEEVTFALGCALTVMPYNAFYGCTGLTALDLSGLTALETLEHRCFGGCTAVETVILPEPSAIKTFVGSPFSGCTSLREINLGSLTEITDMGSGGAFSSCALRTVDLSNSRKLASIPYQCFYNNDKLTVIRLPERGVLREIGKQAFYRAYVNPLYIGEAANPDALAELNLPDSVVTLGESAFENCFFQNRAQEPFVLRLPASLTSLGAAAFACRDEIRAADGARFCANYTLASPELPAGLVSIGGEIGYGPFNSARITALVLPAALTAISGNAFRNLPELESVTFPDGLTEVSGDAFDNYDYGSAGVRTALAELQGFDALTTLETVGGFTYAPLNAAPLVIPQGVKTIAAGAFFKTGAEEIVVPEGVESVGSGAFLLEFGAEPLYPMERRTVTFLDPSPAQPVIAAALLHYEESDYNYQFVETLTPVTIRCCEGSAAHAWALAHNENNPNNRYTIELLGAEPGLYLNLLLPDGSYAPAEAYESAWWTDSTGNLAGQGTYIESFTPGERYTARVLPSADYDWRYRFEEQSVTVVADEQGARVNVRLFERGEIAVAFAVESDVPEEQAISATLSLKTSGHAQSLTQTVRKREGENTLFRFEGVPVCDVELTVQTANRMPLHRTSVQFAADENGLADLGVLTLTEPSPTLSYPLRFWLQDGEFTPRTADFSFTVFNETRGVALDTAEVSGSTLRIGENDADKGDVLRVRAVPNADGNWAQLYPAEATLTVNAVGQLAPYVELRFAEKENLVYFFTNRYWEWGSILVGVYDADGALLESFVPELTRAEGGIHYLAPGDYTLVALQENRQLSPLGQLGQYEALGITDRVLLQAVTVPEHGHASLSGTVPAWKELPLADEIVANASFSVRNWLRPGGTKLVEFGFSLPEIYEGVEKSFSISLRYGPSGGPSSPGRIDSEQGVSCSDPALEFRYEIGYGGTSATVHTRACCAVFSLLVDPSVDYSYSSRVELLYQTENGFQYPLGTEVLNFANISAAAVESPVTMSFGTVTVKNEKYGACYDAALYVDGELASSIRLNGAQETVLTYQLEKVCATHSFQVVVTDENGDVVYRQEPYDVMYLASDGSEPVPASLTVSMSNYVAMNTESARKQQLEIDLLDPAANTGKNLPFYYSLAYFDEDGRFLDNCFYSFRLRFVDYSQVKKDSVRLWLFNAYNNCVGSIEMYPDNAREYFYGEYTLHANHATLESRICSVTLDYQPEQEEVSLIVDRPETPESTGVDSGVSEELAAYLDGFAAVTNDEVEARIQDFEDALGVPLPAPVQAAVREFYYEVNATVGPYYELYRTMAEFEQGLGAMEEQLTNGFSFNVQFGQIPEGFTEEDAQAAGWQRFRVTGEEAGVYVRQEDGYIYCYDFGTGQITRLPLSNSSDEPQPLMQRGDAPARPGALPAFRNGGYPAILLNDGGEERPDASKLESQFEASFSATESLLNYLITEVNALRAAAELADQAGQEYRSVLRFQQAKVEWIENYAPHGGPLQELDDVALARARLDLAEENVKLAAKNNQHWSSSAYDHLWKQQFGNIEEPRVFSEETQKQLDKLTEDVYEKTQARLKAAQEEKKAAEEGLEKAKEAYSKKLAEVEAAAKRQAALEKEAKDALARLKNTGSAEQASRIERMLMRARSLGHSASDFFSNVRAFFSESGLFRVTRLLSVLGGILAVADFAMNCYNMEQVQLAYLNNLNSYEYQLNWAVKHYVEGVKLAEKGKISEAQMEKCKDAYDAYTEQLLVYKDAIEHEATSNYLNWLSSLLSIVLMLGGPIGSLVSLGVALSVILYGLASDLKEEKVKLLDLEWPLEKACSQSGGGSDGGSSGGSSGGSGGGGSGGGGSGGSGGGEGCRVDLKSPALHDPAGIVYEAVLSNAIEGATAKIYYCADDESEVLWDAENYDQLNPQITDAHGGYMWLTPEGKWKVRVSMPGYLDGDSELDPVAVDGWLPVLPPQIHVNIPLVSTAAPGVSAAAASPDGVTVCFTQYMDVARFEGGALVGVTQNGEDVPVTLSWTDAEESPTQPGVFYGRVLKLTKADGSALSGEDIVVTVKAEAPNYAGSTLGADYVSEALTVAQVLGRLEHSYPNRVVAALGESRELVVWVLDTQGRPMSGVTVAVRAELGGTLSIPESAVSDADGRAVFPVQGVSSGYDMLHFSAGVLAEIDMNTRVLLPETASPDKPAAHCADGSPVRDYATVEPGSEITLACETPGAIIYYTTDDTCPCEDSPSRHTYDGAPIVITETTFLRIAAWTEAGGYSERLNLHLRVHEHALRAVERVEPGCESAGNSAYWVCDGCGRLFADADGAREITLAETELAAIGHDWDEWFVTTPPTETENGEQKRVCRNDPAHYETQELPALGAPSYEITLDPGENGEALASAAAAPAGEEITVTVSPYEGYELESLLWSGEDGSGGDITETRSFIMPAAPVTVTVRFKALPPAVYTVTAGGDSVWTQGGGALTITVKRSPDDSECFARFAGVMIDARLLEAGEYSAVQGSTVVTLKAATLQALSVGRHTVTLRFDDGQVDTSLTVKQAPATIAARTGDDDSVTLYVSLLLLSTLGLGYTAVKCRRRREEEE